MRKATLLLPLAIMLALAGGALAPQAHAQKLYRWVDDEGKVHYSQSLPPEAVDQARRELSARSGRTTGEVERALTDEERAVAAAGEAIRAAHRQLELERNQRDQVLSSSYTTEQELTRSYNERFQLVDETLKATRVSVDSQRQTLSSLLTAASNRELDGQPVDQRTRDLIRETYARLESQQTLMQRRDAERTVLDQEFSETLARFRELKGIPAPAGEEDPSTGPSEG